MIRTPSHATVVAYLALVVAMGTGSAYAADQIGSQDIKKNAVRSKHIKDGQVLAADLAPDAVAGSKVADGTLTGSDVADDAITGKDVLESSLGQVPSAATLGGRAVTTFLTNSVYKRESAVDAGTRLGDNTNSKNVPCDAGDVLLSGGVANVNATSDLLESFPTPQTTNGWNGRLFDNGTADTFSIVVLCVDQTP